ncbi:MAG: MTH1187 family thiamine-binding protein [Clostridia bacterium]|nr:MTH1187 family thiamine-binding protein [Deltaproteobacteria bacterium]
MHVIADICVVPITGRVSVRDEVKIAYDILRATGLPVHLHAYGTNIEGDYDAVFLALKRVHQTLHRNGVQRISTTIRVGSRTDKEQTIKDKVDAVMNTEKLADVIPIEEAKA